VDETDQKIVELLRADGRMAFSDLARHVGLSTAPVSRRVAKLEADGVIRGYTAIVDDGATGELDAFTEVRLTGSTDTRQIEEIARQVPEVQQYFTISGDPDALLRFKVRNVEHLQTVVNAIRATGLVAGTKTLIVMSSWDRSLAPVGEAAESDRRS
jgi:Lrp/AsnC family leucine-responsive transcriptional regulator